MKKELLKIYDCQQCNQYKFENLFARLNDVFCFMSLHKFNAITAYSIILYHDYLNKRKKSFEKIFNRYSCLGFTSLNVPPTYLFSKISL